MSYTLYRRRQPVMWSLDLDAIDRARVLAGLSYVQLGRRAHVHRTSLAAILRGSRRPTMSTAHAILRALELDPQAVIQFGESTEVA